MMKKTVLDELSEKQRFSFAYKKKGLVLIFWHFKIEIRVKRSHNQQYYFRFNFGGHDILNQTNV